MKEPPPDPQAAILLGWCLILLLALPFGGFGAWHVASKSAATAWTKTQAEILSSELYRTSKPALWCVKLTLRYQVDGQAHTSKRNASSFFAGSACDRDKRVMDARLERMRPGDRITVRYDPRDPDDAVAHLSPVLEFVDGFSALFALVWFCTGIYAIRTGKQEQREQDAARAASPPPGRR